MAYTAYEIAADAAMTSLTATERQYTNAGSFDETTVPTLTQVEAWLTEVYGRIAAELELNGYSMTQTDVEVLAVLQGYNVKGAAYEIELSRPRAGVGPTPTSGPTPRARVAEFRSWFNHLTKLLTTPALQRLGATTGTLRSAGATVGGTSISEKEDVADDTDILQKRFRRGQFDDPALATVNPAVDPSV